MSYSSCTIRSLSVYCLMVSTVHRSEQLALYYPQQTQYCMLLGLLKIWVQGSRTSATVVAAIQ